MHKIITFVLFIFLGSTSNLALSAEKAPITIPKVDAQITLDGELDEPFWQQATQVELEYETRPGENTLAKIKTTAYIVENSDSILVGFKAYDPNVGQIEASLKDRDTIFADDMVGFKFDTFNDGRKAYNFFINPLGIQMDSIEDDVAGNEDLSWNAIWYSEGKITENGYQVEVRIPFKVLRFLDTQGEKTWGIDFVRMYPREYRYRIAYSKVERNIDCAVCQIAKVNGFESIESGNNLEVTPYVSAQRIDTREPPTIPEWEQGDPEFDGGLDVRWGVTDSSVLNATINPDFSQVESDSIQLNVNTQFALFFEEKRAFFLEGSDYFRTPFNLLHTRNIANPDYGVKYTGKSGEHSYGVLVANDKSTSYLLPGTQSSDLNSFEDLESRAAAFRYSYNIGEKSQIGSIVTHRSGDNYSNNVVGIDGKYQINDEDELRYQLMQSWSTDPVEQGTEITESERVSGNGYMVEYNHGGRNWEWFGRRVDIDNDFRADLGFINQVGYTKDVTGLSYTWQGDDGDIFSRSDIGGDIDQTYNSFGQKIEQEAEIRMSANSAYQSWVGMGGGVRDVWYSNDSLNNDDGLCPSGCWFSQNFFWISGNFRPINSLQLGTNMNLNDSVDFSVIRAAKRKVWRVWTNWQVNKNWFIEGTYINSRLKIDEGRLFQADILNTSSTYQFDKQSYIRLTIQHRDVTFNQSLLDSDTSESINTGRQLLYAYKVNPKTVFFFGYSDGGFEDDSVNKFEKTDRSIFSKFSYDFQL